jgi:hypothetical protein
MNFKWIGLLGLMAALYVGDRIRIERPAHKYRLSMSIDTPDGLKSASGIYSVHPDRNYDRHGKTTIKGDALYVDLGQGRNLVALMAHGKGGTDMDAASYLALRAFSARGRHVSFSDIGAMTGKAAVTGEFIPVLLSFADINDPKTARVVEPDDLATVLGEGVRLRGVNVEVVPNGLWPVDFGGFLGEPVTRGIVAHLPWWTRSERPAAQALAAAGLTPPEAFAAEAAFTRP